MQVDFGTHEARSKQRFDSKLMGCRFEAELVGLARRCRLPRLLSCRVKVEKALLELQPLSAVGACQFFLTGEERTPFQWTNSQETWLRTGPGDRRARTGSPLLRSRQKPVRAGSVKCPCHRAERVSRRLVRMAENCPKASRFEQLNRSVGGAGSSHQRQYPYKSLFGGF